MLAITNTADAHLAPFGFMTAPALLSAPQVADLIASLDSLPASAARQRNASTYAIRHVAQHIPAVAALAQSESIQHLLRPLLQGEPRLVRSLLFDKNPAANWRVPWHQDTTIAVRARHDLAGFGPWSLKAGIPHVQPPSALLERMLTLRIHLDSCPAENGALRILPGSHRAGVLDLPTIQRYRDQMPAITCCAEAGDALLMRPLLLHASSPATDLSFAHRRILHLEYSVDALPYPLEWAD
jgi:ectoine hydroxylase-related dioxygenase (phytanoyl-CoA dioxygenase family)